MSNAYITTDDYISSQRSPPLSPAQIVYTPATSPSPFPDYEDTSSARIPSPDRERSDLNAAVLSCSWTKPSISDSLLIRHLNPDYPEVALRAAQEPISLVPENIWKDRKPSQALGTGQMLNDYAKQGFRTSGEAQFLATAAFEASQKLNAAIGSNELPADLIPHYPNARRGDPRSGLSMKSERIERHGTSPTAYDAFRIMSPHSADKSLDVKPPPRISLPSIRTTSPVPHRTKQDHKERSPATSPMLAKYTITPADGNSEQQLPRLNSVSPSLSASGMAQTSRQILPSLKTALSAISDPHEIPFSGRSPPLTRPSTAQLSHFGPSPSTYSAPSPASAISPPRFTTAPSYWHTTSRETTNSTSSDHASAATSNGVSTPASSVPGHSPAYSGQTPLSVAGNHSRYPEDHHLLNMLTPRQTDEAQYAGSNSPGTFACTFPGCNAPSFQTQYLLNSHANVHSNTRPHFCPVEGCARGPGGQGFKRKNEMIRHGLVHQSPGYVCPFCPDQQHKYPRPDNLQRHVRVHHVDRDRDDPLLREVLAQRPEGGNRGRRRRLGS